jgi:hypothetical protein
MAYRRDWIQPQVGPMGFAGTGKTIGRVVNINGSATGDNVTGNTVGAFKVPAGFTVLSGIFAATDLDAGTNAMTISVGDAASGIRFLNASVIGQAGTTVTAFSAPVVGTNLLFTYTVDTEILITFTLGATVPAAGTISIYLTGFMIQ